MTSWRSGCTLSLLFGALLGRGQTSRAASAPAAADLVRRAYPVDPELLRGASVHLRRSDRTAWSTLWLEAPNFARMDPGDGTGHQVLVESGATRIVPGGGRQQLTDAERKQLELFVAAARAVLLCPIQESSEIVADGARGLRLTLPGGAHAQAERTADGLDLGVLRGPGGVTEWHDWSAYGRFRIPRKVVLEIQGVRTAFDVDAVQVGFLFEASFFLASDQPGRNAGAVDQSGRPRRGWSRLTRPRLLRKEEQTWVVFDDPETWEERARVLGPIGADLYRAHRVLDGNVIYFREGEAARAAIPFKPDPKAAALPLTEELKAHELRVPAAQVVAIDVQGDPKDASAVVPQLMAFCRDQRLEPAGPPRFAPSLLPGDRIPKSLDRITTRVELPVRQ